MVELLLGDYLGDDIVGNVSKAIDPSTSPISYPTSCALSIPVARMAVRSDDVALVRELNGIVPIEGIPNLLPGLRWELRIRDLTLAK